MTFHINQLLSRKLTLIVVMAGLLTYSLLRPSHFTGNSDRRFQKYQFEFTAAGTVQDLHLFPYYAVHPARWTILHHNRAKVWKKVQEITKWFGSG